MGKREGKHDVLVLQLERMLFNTHEYEKMMKFWEYCRTGMNGNSYAGEVDLLAYADHIYDFYEVKSNRTPRAVSKAYEQYDRFRHAFPKWRTNGFLYTPSGLEVIQ